MKGMAKPKTMNIITGFWARARIQLTLVWLLATSPWIAVTATSRSKPVFAMYILTLASKAVFVIADARDMRPGMYASSPRIPANTTTHPFRWCVLARQSLLLKYRSRHNQAPVDLFG